MMNERGFTLIEVTVTLLILAVIGGTVTLRLQGPTGNARLKDAVGRVGMFDSLTRLHAREHDVPLRLVVDLGGSELSRTCGDGTEPAGTTLELSGDCTIERLLISDKDISGGSVSITCSRRGLMPSYAMLVCGRTGRQWLLFCGLTGEILETDHEEEIRETLAATAARNDPR